MRRSTSTPRSETNTVGPDFDDDIIVEILLKLPAKSLLRFRCVCKSWRALISDPSFVRNHLCKVNTNHFKLLVGTRFFQADVISKQDDGDIAISELDYPVTFSELGCFMIYGSCNGLLCVEFENSNIIIWNPLTREFKQLPEPEGGCSHYECDRYVALAGFGYDSTIEDYKVIRVTKVFDDETTLQVFTLKTGSWRTNPDFNHISDSEYVILSRGFLLNETLHWVAHLRGSEYEEGTLGIVTIGLAEEKFQVMVLLPCRGPNRWISSSIVMVGNSLLVHHEYIIWMMKDYGVEESWTEVIYIYPEVLPQGFDFSLKPLCILESGEVLLSHKEALGLYNPRRKRFRNVIWTCEMPYPYYAAYVETLVSPLNGVCENESEMASRVENKGARLEVLSLELPAPPDWSKKVGESERASKVENKGAKMEVLSLVAPPGWSKKGRRRKRQRPKPTS